MSCPTPSRLSRCYPEAVYVVGGTAYQPVLFCDEAGAQFFAVFTFTDGVPQGEPAYYAFDGSVYTPVGVASPCTSGGGGSVNVTSAQYVPICVGGVNWVRVDLFNGLTITPGAFWFDDSGQMASAPASYVMGDCAASIAPIAPDYEIVYVDICVNGLGWVRADLYVNDALSQAGLVWYDNAGAVATEPASYTVGNCVALPAVDTELVSLPVCVNGEQWLRVDLYADSELIAAGAFWYDSAGASATEPASYTVGNCAELEHDIEHTPICVDGKTWYRADAYLNGQLLQAGAFWFDADGLATTEPASYTLGNCTSAPVPTYDIEYAKICVNGSESWYRVDIYQDDQLVQAGAYYVDQSGAIVTSEPTYVVGDCIELEHDTEYVAICVNGEQWQRADVYLNGEVLSIGAYWVDNAGNVSTVAPAVYTAGTCVPSNHDVEYIVVCVAGEQWLRADLFIDGQLTAEGIYWVDSTGSQATAPATYKVGECPVDDIDYSIEYVAICVNGQNALRVDLYADGILQVAGSAWFDSTGAQSAQPASYVLGVCCCPQYQVVSNPVCVATAQPAPDNACPDHEQWQRIDRYTDGLLTDVGIQFIDSAGMIAAAPSAYTFGLCCADAPEIEYQIVYVETCASNQTLIRADRYLSGELDTIGYLWLDQDGAQVAAPTSYVLGKCELFVFTDLVCINIGTTTDPIIVEALSVTVRDADGNIVSSHYEGEDGTVLSGEPSDCDCNSLN